MSSVYCAFGLPGNYMLTAADAVPRRCGATERRCSGLTHSTVIPPPATGIEFKSTGNYRCGVSVAGASLDCQADLGAVGLNTEDPVFSCPSLQPPPSEAPRLATSPPAQKNSYADGGDAILSTKSLPPFVTEPSF
ncbi:hypothetical protein F7725_016152 [Dissostichus mawsoni]|uniref:Uncharacterized protein n=1 Tax=Dissostichus mawsoni TaxID=36200 RepID=A0A7J5Y3T6_DISMA|nr:hypothetical protein F7725_016152 [Dissostichus mawsoni]